MIETGRHNRRHRRKGRPAWHWGTLACLLLASLSLPGPTHGKEHRPARESPPGFRVLLLRGPPAAIIDGDTFEADLDSDGRLDFPRERVRLLYVDTPELHESRKGRDTKFGLPAKRFLAAALAEGRLRLLVPTDKPTGKYGRTLALVEAEGRNVNLALIRAGHSYFDTRFRFPPDYSRYAAAEAEAFDASRGIWSQTRSRRRYLKRLRRELKTPAGKTNSAFEPETQAVESFIPSRFLGRYIRLEGRLSGRVLLSKGARLLLFERGRKRKPFQAIVFRRVAEKLNVVDWPRGGWVRLEGFIKTYKGVIEMVLHHAAPIR